MATLPISPALSPTPPLATAPPARASFRPSYVPFNRPVQFLRKSRSSTLVTRAGPSTSSYVFAFVLPLSLMAITIFSALKLDDRLEKQYLEELIVNEAMKEQEEEEEDDDDDVKDDDEDDAAAAAEDEDEVFMEEKLQESVLPRTRNRPKREV